MDKKEDSLAEAMAARGIRMTAQRKLIAKLFARSSGFVLPRQVHAFIAQYYPGVSYDTVYRNLRLMADVGLIERFDFAEGVRFKLRCGPERHHHHFICTDCLTTYPLDFCPAEHKITPPDAFEVHSHKFEVYGLCGECARSRQ